MMPNLDRCGSPTRQPPSNSPRNADTLPQPVGCFSKWRILSISEMEDGKIEVYFVRDGKMGEVYVSPQTGAVTKLEIKS